MTAKLSITLFFLVFFFSSFGFDFQKYRWYDFKGKIGSSPVTLALYAEEGGMLKGNYCYSRFDQRIALRGNFQNDRVTLQEFIGGNMNGSFEGRIVTDSADRIQGVWKDSSGKRLLEFNLVLTGINSGEPEKKYMDFFGKDEEVEDFMKKVKQAVIKGDKVWLADHVKYPFVTSLDSKTTITVKSKKQFIELSGRILHKDFRERVKELCACNFFANYRGAMIGNGEIWINMKPGSTPKKYSYIITALNN